MTAAHPALNLLADLGVNVSLRGDHLILTGNLQRLTEPMKSLLRREKSVLVAILGHEHHPPYPNQDGMVKCDYCANLSGATCSQGHEIDGTTLLRMCADFDFDADAWKEFYETIS